MPDFRAPCTPGLNELQKLKETLSADLAPGGFTWWENYLDRKRVILASDYLLASCTQVALHFVHAAWQHRVFNEAWFPEREWLRRHLKADDIQGMQMRAEADRDRLVRIEASVTGFFQSLGSMLDCLAALAIGITGFSIDLVRADWGTLLGARDGKGSVLLAEGTAGRAVQSASLDRILQAAEAGPAGWLTWALAMRNLLLHRAGRIEIRHFYKPKRTSAIEYVLLLPRNPQLTEVEALLLGLGVENLVVQEHAGDVMAGLIAQLNGLLTETCGTLTDTWAARREDPALITQPEKQWKEMFPEKRPFSSFVGFSAQVPVPEGQMHVSADLGQRLIAAKVMDADRDFWVREFGSKST
jgi:hypothetical protein